MTVFLTSQQLERLPELDLGNGLRLMEHEAGGGYEVAALVLLGQGYITEFVRADGSLVKGVLG